MMGVLSRPRPEPGSPLSPTGFAAIPARQHKPKRLPRPHTLRRTEPTSCLPTSGSFPQSTPPVSNGGWDRSPRPALPTPAGCWSRPPTTTAAARSSAQRSSAASASASTRDHQHLLARATPTQRPLAPTQRRAPQTRRDRRCRGRSRARRLLLGDRHLPHSAGTDTRPNHPKEAHQLTLNPTTRCGWRGGPSDPGSRTQLRDSSPEHPPPGGRARL